MPTHGRGGQLVTELEARALRHAHASLVAEAKVASDSGSSSRVSHGDLKVVGEGREGWWKAGGSCTSAWDTQVLDYSTA